MALDLPSVGIASPLDSDDASYHTFTDDTTEAATFAVDAFPSDLTSISTLFVTATYSLRVANSDDTYTLEARILASDGTTVLAAGATAATRIVIDSGVTGTTDQTSAAIEFTDFYNSPTPSDWDGALLELFQSHNQTKGPDNTAVRVDHAVLSGTFLFEVTGETATGAVGTADAIGDANTAVTGEAGTGAVGTVTVDAGGGDIIVEPTGVVGTSAVGDETVDAAANVPVTGEVGTSAVGDEAVVAAAIVPVTGEVATGVVGTVIVAEQVVGVTGEVGTSAVGDESVVAEANVPVTGLAATGTIGDESIVAEANTAVTGLAATSAVGTVTVSADSGVAVLTLPTEANITMNRAVVGCTTDNPIP